MANKVIVPQKINYVPQFLKQRDINSYNLKTTNDMRKVEKNSHSFSSTKPALS